MAVPAKFVPDPDEDMGLATTGEEHRGYSPPAACARLLDEDPALDPLDISSFFQAEKLEFSSLRHVKYSSTALLHLLLAEDKTIVTRWPDADQPVDDRCGPDSPPLDESKAETNVK
jgi:hypothetical protein